MRRALGLGPVPLPEEVLARALEETVRRMGCPPGPAQVAVDATGLTPGAVSTFFVKRLRGRGGVWRRWTKWVAVDVPRQVVLAQSSHWGPSSGSATLRPLVASAARLTPMGLVAADAEFDSGRGHRYMREQVGAQGVMPAKRGGAGWRVRGLRTQMRGAFPTHLYRQGALVEGLFSAIKRKLSSRAPGRSLGTQRLQALLLGPAYNVYRLLPLPFHRAASFLALAQP